MLTDTHALTTVLRSSAIIYLTTANTANVLLGGIQIKSWEPRIARGLNVGTRIKINLAFEL